MIELSPFSKDYFDGCRDVPGAYATYEWARFEPAFTSMAQELRNLSPLKRIIDVGCAKGFLVYVLRQQGFEAYGADVSQYAIEQAPDAVRQYLQVADLNKDQLGFPERVFDAAICMGTLEYVREQENTLQEIDRVMVPGGYVFITTLNAPPPGDRFRIYAQSKAHWDNRFAVRGYANCHPVAEKLFSVYVRNIIKYDVGELLKDREKSGERPSLKLRVGQLLQKMGLSPVIRQYFYIRQMMTGYLMLGYKKYFA